jgi:DNA ligase-associated metallophosphoesterase
MRDASFAFGDATSDGSRTDGRCVAAGASGEPTGDARKSTQCADAPAAATLVDDAAQSAVGMLSVAVPGGVQLALRHDRTAWWPAQRTLLVADLHFGKAAAFRRAGVPVPQGTTSRTLETLGAAIDATGAARVVFLGDFLHNRDARAPDTLAALSAWRAQRCDLELVLVRGNHDARAGDPPDALRIDCVTEPWCDGALALAHHPRPHATHWVVAGHLHPCTTLRGRANDRVRLPCFWFGAQVGVLPAFGDFTGMAPIDAAPDDRVFGVAGERVIAIPAAAARRRRPAVF